jgi:hypothetical protein
MAPGYQFPKRHQRARSLAHVATGMWLETCWIELRTCGIEFYYSAELAASRLYKAAEYRVRDHSC